MLAIETINLSKDYPIGFFRNRAKRALDALNLRVEGGEIFGLLGPNGAGKTTTLKLLLGLIFPTSGTARILGKKIGEVSARAQVGYLPENPYFYVHLTAGEFLNYVADLFGLTRAERRRRVGLLLERVGLESSRDVPLGKFSKGMVQRVGIAQALVNDPQLIFLDEPMSGLDPLGRREVRDLILDLRKQGRTVFFSTHILSDAETLCNRVAILNHGRLQGCGELRDILQLGVSSTEIVVEKPPPELLGELESKCDSLVATGDRVRAVVGKESDAMWVVNRVLASGTRLVSLNPVKTSLEDFFLTRVGAGDHQQGETQPTVKRGGDR